MKQILKHLLLALAAIVSLALLANLSLALITQHGKKIRVPDFSNMTAREAEAVAASAQVRVLVSDSVYVKRLRPGAVYMQDPKAGAWVKKGRRIRLTTNTTVAKKVDMPSLIGCSLRQAKAELLRNGLLLGTISYVPDIATNTVMKQLVNGKEIEAGESITSGAIIDLVLGLNPRDDRTFVPNLVGQQYRRAIDVIQDNSLNVATIHFDRSVRDYADSLRAVVYKQQPVNDSLSVLKGTGVSLYLTVNEDIISKIQTIQ